MHGQAALGTVRALAGDIGPRGTGTPAEAAARDLVAARLAELGLAVERQAFRTVASQNAFPLAIDALALGAMAAYAAGSPLARWVGAVVALATAPLLWHTIRTSGRWLAPFRAVCIAGIDPATNTLAHWHRSDDTPDMVSVLALRRALAYLEAFLESLDAEPASP